MKHITFIFGIVVIFLCSALLFPVSSQNASSKIPDELVQQLIRDINTNNMNFRLSDRDLTVLRENLRYELHDLNGDSTPEFFLYIDHSDWCGAGSNCSYWVYQKIGGVYKLLLEEKGLNVMDTVTKGYHDLESRVPVGFCAVNVQRYWVSLYKYNGERYQFASCADRCVPFTPR